MQYHLICTPHHSINEHAEKGEGDKKKEGSGKERDSYYNMGLWNSPNET